MQALSPGRLSTAELTGLGGALHLLQAMAAPDTPTTGRVWIVTRGAQRVLPSESVEAAAASVWGLGRTAALELPRSWGGLIDLRTGRRPSVRADADRLAGELLAAGDERQIALRGRRRFVARLARVTTAPRDGPSVHVGKEGTYLITGGLGMLGLAIATWLVRRGLGTVALVGRGEPSDEARAAIAAMEATGARVVVVCADVTRDADVRRVLETIRRDHPPLRGVVHAAGVLADGVLARLEWARFTEATAPKIRGAWLLHHHTRQDPLDCFLLQSSWLSLTGSAGQANYTAGNAFLDALVDHRRACGLPAAGVNWGPWAGGGLAASSGSRGEAIWRTRGISPITPVFGEHVLDHVFETGRAHVAAVQCDWSHYLQQRDGCGPFFARQRAETDVDPAPVVTGERVRARMAAASASGRRDLLVRVLQDQVTQELGFDEPVDPDRPIHELGLDSLMSVNLANRLQAHLELPIEVATLIRGPSLHDLAGELLVDMVLDPAPSESTVSEADTVPDAAVSASGHSTIRGHGWLVFPRPNPDAAIRLYCFNYSGAGAATFHSWAEGLDPAIELVAIEPPGRGSRIDESSITRLETYVERLTTEMGPYLDKPCALFGHCLGALSLYETARALVHEGLADVMRLFVSGARPPHSVADHGAFEEALLTAMLADARFNPLRPFHEQPDEVFAEVIRHFNIQATSDFLAEAELRELLFPAIRADFEMASRYRWTPEPAWDIPLTCFRGLEDCYVTREEALAWGRYTKRDFHMHHREGNHFLIVEDRDFIVAAIGAELLAAPLASIRTGARY